jgi:hypothetical protein
MVVFLLGVFMSNCIGDIKGTHICAYVSQENQISFIRRRKKKVY